MATVPDFRLDALHAPGPDTVIEHLYDLCAPKQGNSGDRAMDLTRLGVLPHGRQLETASLDDLCKVFGALVDAGSADGKPGMMAVGLPARGNADSAAVGDARMKAALAQALLQYLWRCDDRGGLRFSATAVLLPAVPTSASNPLAASGATSSAPSAAASSNSVPSSPSSAPASSTPSTATAATASPSSPATTAGATNAGKRLLSEISDVAANLAEESVAGDSQRPPKKQSLVYTTISSKYAEEDTLYLRAIEIGENTLGSDHPDLATRLNNRALLLGQQGKFAEAEPLYRRANEIWETALGPEHPNVATTLNNRAGLLESQGKYEEAEPLYGRATAIWEKALGADHPTVATVLNNRAGLLQRQGKYDEADPLYARVLQILAATVGEEHPNYAEALNKRAGLLKAQGKYAEAEPLYARCQAIEEKSGHNAQQPGGVVESTGVRGNLLRECCLRRP